MIQKGRGRGIQFKGRGTARWSPDRNSDEEDDSGRWRHIKYNSQEKGEGGSWGNEPATSTDERVGERKEIESGKETPINTDKTKQREEKQNNLKITKSQNSEGKEEKVIPDKEETEANKVWGGQLGPVILTEQKCEGLSHIGKYEENKGQISEDKMEEKKKHLAVDKGKSKPEERKKEEYGGKKWKRLARTD